MTSLLPQATPEDELLLIEAILEAQDELYAAPEWVQHRIRVLEALERVLRGSKYEGMVSSVIDCEQEELARGVS